jgi:hypothetical protein
MGEAYPATAPMETTSGQRHRTYSLAGLPDGDRQLAILEFDRRCAGQVGDEERIELLASQVEAGFLEEVVGESPMEVRVLDIPGLAPQFGIAVADVRIDGGRMKAEPWVAFQVAELGGVRHADEHQATVEDPGFHRADPGITVGADRGKHAEVPGRGMPPDEHLRDLRRLFREITPGNHRHEC